MAFSVTIVSGTVGFMYLVWYLVRNFFTKSPLDNVPGPKPESLITGSPSSEKYHFMLTFCPGDMIPLFHRIRGWEYNSLLRENYGTVVRIQGFLGVGHPCHVLNCSD